MACAPSMIPSTVDAKKEPGSVAQYLSDETIALVSLKPDDEWMIDCGGIWVDWNIILTAYHCVNDEKAPNKDGTGAEFFFSTKENFDIINNGASKHYKGKVVAIDKYQDLALIKAANAKMNHRTVTFATREPHIGDETIMIGHPNGLPYSYTHGHVSGFHSGINSDAITARGPFIKINAVIIGGNSGGGVFNTEGQLIGMIVFTRSGIQQGFIVPLGSIKKFLENYEKNKKQEELKATRHVITL